MANSLSGRRALIDKANTTVVVVVSIAAFIVVFSLVATKTLVSQASYQNRVISAKRATVTQLKTDISSTKQLKTSYDAFIGTPQNVLGGNPSGTGPQDGDNAKIVLDALPSSYDFPGLTTSLESILSGQPVAITSIGGTDDEVAQSANQSSSTPISVAMPFQLTVTGNYAGVQGVIGQFEKSIRPLQIQTLDLSGNQAELTLNLTAETYYQPAKSLNITTKVIQ